MASPRFPRPTPETPPQRRPRAPLGRASRGDGVATGHEAWFPLPPGPVAREGRWIEHWDPEDATFWRSTGRRVARRNLAFSVFAEFLGFCVWALWSVVVPLLPAAGFDLTLNEQFWLIAVPSLVGATIRIPYTFAVPAFGGRNWTVISSLLLLLPTSTLAWVVTRPETSFGVLLVVAALAGFGGGNSARR